MRLTGSGHDAPRAPLRVRFAEPVISSSPGCTLAEEIGHAVKLPQRGAAHVPDEVFRRDLSRTSDRVRAVVTAHHADVILYDIAVPYERNWQFLTLLRDHTLSGSLPLRDHHDKCH